MKIAILGTAGVPARYGGFETLAENLVQFHASQNTESEMTVYCTSVGAERKELKLERAELRYLKLRANGIQSVLYDTVSLIDAVRRGTDVVFLMGISGAIALPCIRRFSNMRVVTNVDGIEWKRSKWNAAVRKFLRLSERIAVRHSDAVIADNAAIHKYLKATYGVNGRHIAYGGDHAIRGKEMSEPDVPFLLPERYALSICRVEPENNIDMIIEAFAQSGEKIVMIGNWDQSRYGRKVRERFREFSNILLEDPIYDVSKLHPIRAGAEYYIHGHSAGGTNPSLVEMMHFGRPIVAFDCSFNRHTTAGQAFYFSSAEHLANLIPKLQGLAAEGAGRKMRAIARERYNWDQVSRAYFDLAEEVVNDPA